jgi:hypothetical protein
MAIIRRDDWLTTPQGQALAGALVYYLTQPANTAVNPPTPLATVYSDNEGTVATNPQMTDGYGHAVAYLDNGQLYTIAFYHPVLGATQPLVLADQSLNSTSSSAPNFFGEVPAGAIDGTNRVFTTTKVYQTSTVWLNFPLIPGLGYSTAVVDGVFTITYARAPQPAAGGAAADSIYIQGTY